MNHGFHVDSEGRIHAAASNTRALFDALKVRAFNGASMLLGFAAGLVLLIVGAEALVRGASRLAASFGVTPLVIGLTVVAFGTSAPEMAVSVQAALDGKADLAFGNVAGSNILNILLIIGVRQAHRGRGINLAMAARSYLAMMARGYKTASYTVVLDDNWPSRRTAEKLGCKVIRNFVVYRKELS